MAVYYPDSSGNAPSNAKAGDQIVTAGGTYEVVDGSQYQGMSSSDLLKSGVGYNPSTGLYSKKVSTITSKDAFLQNTNTADKWLKESNENITNKLNADYNTNISSLMRDYNTNLAGLKQQQNQTNAEYDESIQDSKKQSYYDAQESILGASRNGISNGMLAQAGANNAFYSGSQRTTDLARDRITALNDIYTNINTLTQNYNISLTELEKNKLAQELSALSDNQLAYLEQVMNIDTYNADVLNSITQTRQEQEWQAAENAKDREENQKDRDLQLKLAMMSNSGSGGGGYSGGSGSGSSGNSSEDLQSEAELALLDAEYYADQLTDAQRNTISYWIQKIPYGESSREAVQKLIQSYLQENTKESSSGKKSSSSSAFGNTKIFVRNPYNSGKGSGAYNNTEGNWNSVSSSNFSVSDAKTKEFVNNLTSNSKSGNSKKSGSSISFDWSKLSDKQKSSSIL